MKPLAVMLVALITGTVRADLPEEPVEQLRFRIGLVDSIIVDECLAVSRTGNPRDLVKYTFRRVGLTTDLALKRFAKPKAD